MTYPGTGYPAPMPRDDYLRMRQRAASPNPAAAPQTPSPGGPGMLPWETGAPGGGSGQGQTYYPVNPLGPYSGPTGTAPQSAAPGGGQQPFGLTTPQGQQQLVDGITGLFRNGNLGGLDQLLSAFSSLGGGRSTGLGLVGQYLGGQGGGNQSPQPSPQPQPSGFQEPQLMQRPRLPNRFGGGGGGY